VIAAKQLHGAVTVALGLEDTALFYPAQLADGAVAGVEDGARSLIQRAGTVSQCAGEEGIEVLVGRGLLDLGLTHVDLKMPDEPLDEGVLHPRQPALGQAASQAGDEVMGQHVLADDEQAIFHVGPFHCCTGVSGRLPHSDQEPA